MGLALFILAAALGVPPPVALAACLAGDVDSLRAFVRHFTPIFRARVRRALLGPRGAALWVSRDDVDDVVQLTFEAIFSRGARVLRDYDPDRGMSLDSYLGQIASREAHNYLDKRAAAKRGGGRREVVTDPSEGPIGEARALGLSPEASYQLRQEARRLEEALLSRLSAKGRIFFHLLYVEELEVEEIQARLGVSRDAVYTWRKRIKAAFVEAQAEAEGRADA